jgi:NADH-quinone oxidoreductase subunit N
MVVVAFGFKVAAAPFHLWAPDAYEGAPTASSALIASASKLAGFTVFFRLFWPGLRSAAGGLALHQAGGWMPVVCALCAASLLLGNVGALAQRSVRRLFAYSAIAHAGALILGVLVAGKSGPGALYYYALTYGIATAGVFGVFAAAERSGPVDRIEDLAGMRSRSPLLAACLLICVLSLAGIPPLAGFFGKFYVFSEALGRGPASPFGALAFLAIGMSAVALYYYLKVLKQVWVEPAAPQAAPIEVPGLARLWLVVCPILLVLLGVAPSLLNELLP